MSIKIAISSLKSSLLENSTTGTIYRLGLFIILYFIGRYVLLLYQGTTFISILHKPLLWFIDNIAIGFWSIFYPNLSSTADYIISINNMECIQLMPGCSGLHPILRMTFILLLYPIPWKIKSWLFPLSWIIILFAATIHFILLIPISYHWSEYYNFSHDWLTKIIFYGFYFLTWLLWEKVGYPKSKKKDSRSAMRDKTS